MCLGFVFGSLTLSRFSMRKTVCYKTIIFATYTLMSSRIIIQQNHISVCALKYFERWFQQLFRCYSCFALNLHFGFFSWILIWNMSICLRYHDGIDYRVHVLVGWCCFIAVAILIVALLNCDVPWYHYYCCLLIQIDALYSLCTSIFF